MFKRPPNDDVSPLLSCMSEAEVESAPVLADKKKLPFVHSFQLKAFPGIRKGDEAVVVKTNKDAKTKENEVAVDCDCWRDE